MTKQAQATWGGRFREGPSELMQRFSESVSFDHILAPYDIQCSLAHAEMLHHVGLLTKEDLNAIITGLEQIWNSVEENTFEWDESFEDVHMNIEQALLKITPAAARLHAGRSRNDQIATDMRLFLKDVCSDLDLVLTDLLRALVELADTNREVILPGYTHLQRAQPVTIAHHLLAYAEMFSRDRKRMSEVHERANICPLGSGALAGTTLPIDRSFTAEKLGFIDLTGHPRITLNSMDAVADRDLYTDFTYVCACIGVHISRVTEDMILWNSSEFAFVDLPEAYTTGSSLMPQKKNPDSLELLRGKTARLQGNLQTLLTLCKGLPLTYNRDLQEDKPPVFDSYQQTAGCLEVLTETLKGTKFNAKRCAKAAADPLLLATDLADYLVESGVPFRESHHIVGALVALAEDKQLPLNELEWPDVQAVDGRIPEDWVKVFSIERSLSKRELPGMPGPKQVAADIARWRQVLDL